MFLQGTNLLTLPSEGRGQRFESSQVRHKINNLRDNPDIQF